MLDCCKVVNVDIREKSLLNTSKYERFSFDNTGSSTFE